MRLHWTDIALVVGIVAAGSAIIYFLLLRRLERILAASHREMEHRLAALTEAINRNEPDSDEAVPATDALGADEMEVTLSAEGQGASSSTSDELRAAVEAGSHEQQVGHEDGNIPADIQVAITAAAIAAFGNHARVRSARQVPSSDVVSPWTQQGRVIVQSSHNLRTRG